jgi:nifR3 family TIM-barrel protein
VQINARTPAEARDAARVVEDGGYALLDFNLGCPVRKIVRKGGGAALGCSAVEAAEVVHHAVSAVKIPVTAKLRLGWDSAQLTAPDVAKELQAAGVAALAVHGRTRCQAFSGAVDREGIRQTVAAVTVPVFANGDILTVEDIVGMLRDTGAAGVMVGRGVIADPWLFSEAWRRLGVGDAWREPGVQQRADALLQHYTRLLDSRPEPVATAQFRKVLRTISKALGAPEALVARGGLVSNALEVATYIDLLRGLPDGPIVRSNVVPTPKRPVDHW